MNNTTIGDRVKNLRKAQGLSQKDFAEMLNLSQGFISKVEINRAQFTIEHIVSIANIFDVDLNLLLTGEVSAQHKKPSSISQHASGNTGIIQAGVTSGSSITQGGDKLPEDLLEIVDLLQRYGNKAIKDDIKARLLRIKEAIERE